MRPIDADVLQESLRRKKAGIANLRYTEGFNDALLKFKSMIHGSPTVQTEVRHGRWRKHGYDEWICTECGYDKYCDTLGGCVLPPYCEMCGVKMEVGDGNV